MTVLPIPSPTFLGVVNLALWSRGFKLKFSIKANFRGQPIKCPDDESQKMSSNT